MRKPGSMDARKRLALNEQFFVLSAVGHGEIGALAVLPLGMRGRRRALAASQDAPNPGETFWRRAFGRRPEARFERTVNRDEAAMVRIVVRVLLTAVFTGALCVARLLAWPVGWIDVKAGVRARQALVRCWGRGVARIIGMRVETIGPLPTPPYCLVANHVSHLDAYLLAGLLGCTFVVKHDVADWPVLGSVARLADAIFVNRAKASDTLRVNEQVRDALARGEGMVIFVESTTSQGHSLLPFKSALLEAPVRNACPVHYATIHYETPPGTPPASEWISWWDDTPFPKHVAGILKRPGFKATVRFGEEPISAPDRKTLAKQLQAACEAQFIPLE